MQVCNSRSLWEDSLFDNLWTVVTNPLKSGNSLSGITIPVTTMGFLYRFSYLKRFVVTGGWILIFKSLWRHGGRGGPLDLAFINSRVGVFEPAVESKPETY